MAALVSRIKNTKTVTFANRPYVSIMKIIVRIFLSGALMVWWLVSAAQNALPFSKNAFIVIAHRADHVAAPENSLAAIDSAIVHHADYVELDLRTSADSVLVIMHDGAIGRTTTGNGQVAEMPIAVLDTCHLQNTREGIPHFESCLQHCANKINIYLDFKNADVRQTLAILKKYHFEKSVLVYINTLQQYDEWRKWAPQIPIIISLPDDVKTPEALDAFLKKYPAEVLDGNFSSYTPAMIARAKALGVKVWPDIQSANEMDNWPKALATGFDGLQTDHPLALIQWLQSRQIR